VTESEIERKAVAERFGANLQRARRDAGHSQEAFAAICGLHRTEVSMIERGARSPRIDTLVKLAGALEVTPNELLAGIDWQGQRYERPRGCFYIDDRLVASI
jgi:transcriptional regulator with XRE-family HTH domain